MTMDTDYGMDLPHQGFRRPRCSACGGSTVPAPPTSRGHRDPESCDGLPILLPVRRVGEDAFAEEVLRRVVDLLDVFVRHTTKEDDREGLHVHRRGPVSEGPQSPSTGATPAAAGDLERILRSMEGLLNRVSRLEERMDSIHQSPVAAPRRDITSGSGQKGRTYAAVARSNAAAAGRGSAATSDGPIKEVHRQEAVSGDTTRCHLCRARGHLRKECPVPVDMRTRCYWCGVVGHRAADCGACPFCWACHTRGKKNTRHAAGGKNCPEYPPAGVSSTTDEERSPSSHPPSKTRRGRIKKPAKEGGTLQSPPSQEGKKKKEEVIPHATTSQDGAEKGVSPTRGKRGKPPEKKKKGKRIPVKKSQGAHSSPREAEGGPGDSSVKEEVTLEAKEEDVRSPGDRGTLTSPHEAGGGPHDPNGVEDSEDSVDSEEEWDEDPHPKGGEKKIYVGDYIFNPEYERKKLNAALRCGRCRVRGHSSDDCYPTRRRLCWRCWRKPTGKWHEGYEETRSCKAPDPVCYTCRRRKREYLHVPGDRDLCLPIRPRKGFPTVLTEEETDDEDNNVEDQPEEERRRRDDSPGGETSARTRGDPRIRRAPEGRSRANSGWRDGL